MDISELPAFLGTLRPDTNLWTFIPGNAEYHGFPKEWQNAKPDARFSCRSSVADFLEVRIFRMDTKRVGVWMYTDWN